MSRTISDEVAYVKDDRSNLPLYDFLATGLAPEFLIRIGIREMLRQKLVALKVEAPELAAERTRLFAEELKSYPIAIETDAANAQHYEVPAEFFRLILGTNMKYSCCFFEEGDELDVAEKRMLELTCQRAEIQDGQRILDLGCGWGSFTFHAARNFPNAQITAVSNSHSQRQFIERLAKQRGLNNVQVITADVNRLDFANSSFDRVVSVEMFEHAKNYQLLLKKIAGFLSEDGKLFVHIFTHKTHQYHFGESDDDWLARYFFSGGTMPSHSLLFSFQDDLQIRQCWEVSGTHYQRTAEAWLDRMSKNRAELMQIIIHTYGADQAKRWWVYWRLFFLACSELWGYAGGREWMVSHYSFEKVCNHN